MTSKINTNGIDVNYPVPGQNNSSQGFRDNFAQIRTQLNTGATEITDLQSKVVVKAALNDSTLNNDMGNTLISNASTRGFRATTYNLGNALAGTVVVDVNRADVQFGALQGNVVLSFGNWAPTNTQSNVVLRLTFANTDPAYISLPNSCVSSNNNFGVTLLENYTNANGTATLSAPANANIVELRFSTIDCGNTVTVEPVNRPYQSTQVITRDPAPTGLPGDVNGDVAVGASIGQVTANTTLNGPAVITANTFTSTGSSISGTTLTIGTVTAGTVSAGMLLSGSGVAANTYIVSNQTGTGSGSTWTVSPSQTVSSTAIDGSTGIVTEVANVASPMYNVPILTVGVQTSGVVQPGMILSGANVTANTFIVKNLSGSGNGSTWQVSTVQNITDSSIGGNIGLLTVSDTTGFYRDMPITFTGTTFGGITAGATYYIKEVASGNSITLSTSPGGTMLTLSNASGTMSGNPVTYMYVSTATYNSISNSKTVTNTYVTTNNIKLGGIGNLTVNAPIVFTGNVFGGVAANTVYYVKSIDSGNSNITVSQSRYNGIAGSPVLLTTANGSATATFYIGGNDIWRQIPLFSELETDSNISAANIVISDNLTVGGNTTLSQNLTIGGNVVINGNLDVNGTVIDTLNANNINTVNFTSSGTFTANTLSGNINAINLDVSGIANIPTVGDIRIGGGLNGYYLITDGTGNLSWVSGGGSGNGTVAGSNTQIQFNNAGSFGAVAGLTFDSVTNVFSAPGNIVATGNTSGGNLTTSGALSVTGNANVGNLGTGGLIVATGNITGGNLVTSGALSVTGNANVGNIGGTTGVFTTVAGALTTAAQPNITSVGTLTSLGVSGNTTSNNISSNNYVIVSANSSITAAGTTQGTATQLASSINVVTTVPASSGVKLPVAEAGMRIIVRNSTATALNVYPNTGAAIEPALANAPYTLNATTSMEFFCSTGGGSGQWFTLF